MFQSLFTLDSGKTEYFIIKIVRPKKRGDFLYNKCVFCFLHTNVSMFSANVHKCVYVQCKAVYVRHPKTSLLRRQQAQTLLDATPPIGKNHHFIKSA